MNPTLDVTELTQNIGRLFIAGLASPEVDADTVNLIRRYQLGGIILFSRNVREPLQLARLCSELQKVSMEDSGFPLFLAIDQEGGRVSRLKPPFSQFPGNEAIGNRPNPEESALHYASITAKEMALVGLNMNLAPVMDVTQPNMDSHLLGRTFSHDPSVVAKLGEIVIETLQRGGVMAVAKHFPGLGSSNLDPHQDLPTVEAPLEEMDSIHLPPFAAAIAAHVSAIMTSHAVYPALEPGVPATLSRNIISNLLREQMNFSGLIISDDLEMGAIAKDKELPEATAEAFEAGIDILLICSNQDLVIAGIESIRDKVLRGQIPEERLQESLERVKKYKKRFLCPHKETSLRAVENYFRNAA
ncbi:MAG: beta-N-acetylhexosaminidase [Deltaproteobacteria bacterium]|nr:MAG: beta-N-acetylhexosaminidase [Deltaproteobacteria bacterium]